MKRISISICLLLLFTVIVKAGYISSGSVYRISTTYTENRTLMITNSSFDSNTKATLWTETSANSQRWRISDTGDGNYFIDNVYSGKRLYQQSTTSISQSTLSTATTFQWILSPVNETGYENCFYISNKSNPQYVLEIAIGTETVDGGTVAMVTKASTKEPRQIWKLESATDVLNQLTPALRTTMIQDWKNKNLDKLKTSNGFWGEAECMEIILDAYETSGREEYKTMFEEVYKHFVSGTGGWTTTNGKNWMWNEFNDDIVWATLASIRAYFMFGNNAVDNLDYLSIAKTNFDNMYSRALLKVDGLYDLLRWKQSSTSINTCVNAPAIVACCYLAEATGQDVYYQRAKQLYANVRVHLYSASTGRVYDTYSNNWASTYNEGSYLGAAVMLYNHFGDEMYKKDAEMIMQFTRNNLCNSSGVVNVCGDEGTDLSIFKGILMRYARRFVVDLGKTEYFNWMQLNALQAYNNRNSEGISWSAWWKKTEERDYSYLGSFTAVSAVVNAGLDINTVARKDAFSTIQAGSFNYISKVNSQNNLIGEQMDIVDIQNGAYLGYNFVDFKNRLATGIELLVANDVQTRSVEIRLGSSKGSLMGTINIPASNGSFITVQGLLDRPIDGNENIYLVFKGNKNGLRLKFFKFTSNSNALIYPDITNATQGVVTSSHTIPKIENAINDRLSDEAIFSIVASDQVWIQYEASNPVMLSGYALASGNGASGADPKSWKLQASNNGTDWIDLNVQSDQTFDQRCQLKKYTLTLTEGYRYFRLNVTERNGSSTELRMSEWQLYGSELSINDITSDGGTLTAQYAGISSAENVEKLTDNTIGTKYNTDNTDLWIQYKAQARYKLKSYSISVANEEVESDPKNWVLYGSVNGIAWEIIDSISEQVFSTRNSTQTYSCNSEFPYNYFKLHITENNGVANTQIAEWQLFGDLYFDYYYQDFTKSGGKLSSSSNGTPEALQPLTDNNATTCYSLNSTVLPVWVQYQSPTSVSIQGYSITSSGCGTCDPKSWKLQGSNDGIIWIDIDTRTNIIFESRYLQKKYVPLSIPTYSQFRLLITAANSNEVRIADWQVYGIALNRYDVTSNPGGDLTTQWPGKNDANSSGKLIDKSKDTKYYNEGRKSFWAIYKSTRPVKLTAYSLMSANDYEVRDPKIWTLYGSNDSIVWTVIDHRENQSFVYRQTTQYYPITTDTRYKFFKLHVEDNLGEKGVQMSEWQLFGEFNEYGVDITKNGGVLTSSNAATNQTVLDALIDNSETSKYYAAITSAQYANGVWFKYESPEAVLLTSYCLTSSNDNPNNDPKTWILQGSNDNINWVDLNAQSDVSFDSRCERKIFSVAGTTAYKYFRLLVSAAKVVTTGFQLAEWELFGTPISEIHRIEMRNTLEIYPNPAFEYITIEIPEECSLSIRSVNGATLYNENVQKGIRKIHLEHYEQGIYIVKLESRNIMKTSMLIKK